MNDSLIYQLIRVSTIGKLGCIRGIDVCQSNLVLVLARIEARKRIAIAEGNNLALE